MTTKLRKPKTFTIDRSKWVRGGENGASRLLNYAYFMCCMGFYARACGVPTTDLLGRSYPDEVECGCVPGIVTKKGGKSMKAIGWDLAAYNDNSALSEASRELKVRACFKRIGVTVKFTGPKP